MSLAKGSLPKQWKQSLSRNLRPLLPLLPNVPSINMLRPRSVQFLFKARVRVVKRRANLQQVLTPVEHPRIGPLTPRIVEHLFAPAQSMLTLLILLTEKQTLRKTCPCPFFALNVPISTVTFM